jgi:hypothetical protein
MGVVMFRVPGRTWCQRMLGGENHVSHLTPALIYRHGGQWLTLPRHGWERCSGERAFRLGGARRLQVVSEVNRFNNQ